MKVFLSWSGERSREVAGVLKEWLPSVIQILKPYVSSEDIEKGARWSLDIAKELESSSFGILCITPENLTAPWIQFEAGALSRMLDVSRVTPLLVGVKPSDLQGPLLQFQATVFQKEDIWRLVKSLNRAAAVESLDEARLRQAFHVWWPTLQVGLKKIESTALRSRPVPQRNSVDILDEILELLRDQQRLLRSPQGLARVDRAAEALEEAAKAIVYRGEYRVPLDDREEPEGTEREDRLNTRTTLGRSRSNKT